MKKQHPRKEEFLQTEYDLNECKSVFSEELKKLIEDSLALLRPFFTIIFPLRNELIPVIEKFMILNYPQLNNFTQKWQKDWKYEIADDTAYHLGTCFYKLFELIENGKPMPEEDNFENMIKLFARPQEPYLNSLATYADWNLTEEQKIMFQEFIDEANQIEIDGCEQMNMLKTDYIKRVQPILFTYFGHLTDDMTLEMWNHYGVEMGFSFSILYDNCLGLLHEFIDKNLTESPNMNFFEYKCMRSKN